MCKCPRRASSHPATDHGIGAIRVGHLAKASPLAILVLAIVVVRLCRARLVVLILSFWLGPCVLALALLELLVVIVPLENVAVRVFDGYALACGVGGLGDPRVFCDCLLAIVGYLVALSVVAHGASSNGA